MATLVVEDGTRPLGANTFIASASVGTYFDDVGLSRIAWDALSTAKQDAANLRAARFHELEYGDTYQGHRQVKAQAMSWPRHNVTGKDGYMVANDSVPAEIPWAQAELIHRTVDGTPLVADVTTSSVASLRSKRRKVGDLETEDTYQESAPSQSRWTYVERLLEWYQAGTSENALLERA